MKTILKSMVALSLVSSVAMGADQYTEQKEKIVKELVNFYNQSMNNVKNFDDYKFKSYSCNKANLENDEKEKIEFKEEYGCALVPDKNTMKYFPDELKKYFSDDFLNVLSNGDACFEEPGADGICYDISTKVEDYEFICDNGKCKIDEIVKNGWKYKEQIDDTTKRVIKEAKTAKKEKNEFDKKLANYTKKYKVSKEFYEKFKTDKKPLIEYFSADLKNGLNNDELETYQNYKSHFEAESEECKDKISLKDGMITLFLEPGSCSYCGGDTYLIFSCKKDKCEIIDIGVAADCTDNNYIDYSWLKK